jgi:hypothetical protein
MEGGRKDGESLRAFIITKYVHSRLFFFGLF